MALGFCPNCNRNMLLAKHDVNVCLLCLLFLTGIGWIIYLIIYALEPDDVCSFCGTPAQPPIPESQNQFMVAEKTPPPQFNSSFNSSSAQTVFTTGSPPSPMIQVPESKPSPNVNFCPQCGSSVDADARFCSVCGGNLKPT